MKRFILASVTASIIGAAATAVAAPPPVDGVDVMTQNQYVGANLFPLIPAASQPPAVFNEAVKNVARIMAANRTAARVTALAGEIAARNPHLVGVQEAWSVTCEPRNAAPCTNTEFAAAWGDFLEITTQALGTRYKVVGAVENFVVDIPIMDDGYHLGLIHVMDRDVILARSDVSATVVRPSATTYPCGAGLASADGCNFSVDIPLAAFGTSLKRGFVIADATVNGKAYRFVNTHLENGYADGMPGVVQSAQAMQLIQTVLNTTPPGKRLIVVGDTNSDANDPVDPESPIPATPYMLFTAAEFYDGWLLRPGKVAGFSCCQLEDLTNRVSILARRIDLVLTREMPKQVKDARLIGEVAADRLPPKGRGLWPSDHAAVAAGLRY